MSIFVTKNHEKSTFSFKSCENRYPQCWSWSRSRNFLKVRAGAGAETNSFGSATLQMGVACYVALRGFEVSTGPL